MRTAFPAPKKSIIGYPLGLDRQKLSERWQPGLQFGRDAINELPVKAQAFLAAQLRVEVKKEIWLESDWEDWQLYAVRAARELLEAEKPAEALSLIGERPSEIQSNELKTIEIDALIEFEERNVNLVSLGSGDGEIDVVILSKLSRRIPKFQYYYCVDISFELLQKAVAKVIKQAESQNFAKRFNVKAIHGDFTELRRLAPIYTYDESINLFTLNGSTFGNYNEVELLQAIREGMEFNDLLFFDVRLHRLNDWDGKSQLADDQKQEVIVGYDNELNNRFAFGPVEYATNLSFSDLKFGYGVHRQVTSVPKAINVVTFCKDISLRLRRDNKMLQLKRLDLAVTTLYSYENLVDWLPAKGFKLVWSKADTNLAMFLLRKE